MNSCLKRYRYLSVFCIALVHSARCSALTQFENSSIITDAFPQLQDLQRMPSGRSPYIGGQNFDQHCCWLAVNESLRSFNDTIVAAGNFLTVSANVLWDSQFPCGARYSDNQTGSPVVTVPYRWCQENCPGWELSRSSSVSQWVQPLVGFILPAVVFCLTIPRQQKLRVPDRLFDVDLNRFCQLPVTPLLALGTGILVSLDILGWVAISFTFSGPMLLSGLYEAHMDKRLLSYVEDKLDDPRVTFDKRARILYAILIGNLSLSEGPVGEDGEHPAWTHMRELSQDLPSNQVQQHQSAFVEHDGEPRNVPQSIPRPTAINPEDGPELSDTSSQTCNDYQTPDPEPRSGILGSPALRSPHLSAFGCRRSSSRDGEVQHTGDKETAPILLPDRLVTDAKATAEANGINGALKYSTTDTARTQAVIDRTKIRLRAMLACQYSFGSVVGAPVVFYVGSFIYALIEVGNSLGDNDTSHALAFGMWWMTIPHIAIISGCLLAGNNPNMLEGIVGHLDSERSISCFHLVGYNVCAPVFESGYRPAWMWSRGGSKRAWAEKICDEYNPRGLREEIRMKIRDWFKVASVALFLVAVPSTLAMVTSYQTPEIGLSCRSLTVLVYQSSETLLILLWVWEGAKGASFGNRTRWLWRILVGLGSLGAVFTAIGGTMMQIMGVYRNCLCNIPLKYWLSQDSTLSLSTNNPLAIESAQHVWIPAGVVSIAFLCTVCFIGWWYQRHMRFQFRTVVGKFDYVGPPF